jgi:hypothetical protein
VDAELAVARAHAEELEMAGDLHAAKAACSRLRERMEQHRRAERAALLAGQCSVQDLLFERGAQAQWERDCHRAEARVERAQAACHAARARTVRSQGAANRRHVEKSVLSADKERWLTEQAARSERRSDEAAEEIWLASRYLRKT